MQSYEIHECYYSAYSDNSSATMSATSTRPVTSIQVPVADGLGDVHGLYLLCPGEVGDGAGYLDTPVLPQWEGAETLGLDIVCFFALRQTDFTISYLTRLFLQLVENIIWVSLIRDSTQ